MGLGNLKKKLKPKTFLLNWVPGVQVVLGAALVPAHAGDQQLCQEEGEVGVLRDEGHVPGLVARLPDGKI